MFDQLVESKSNASENRRKLGFLSTVGVIVTTIFVAGLLISLFAKDLAGMSSGDDLMLSSLVTPVPVPEQEPPKPEPPKPEEKQQTQKQSNSTEDTRTELIQRMDESPQKPPDKVSSKASDTPTRTENSKIGQTNNVVAPETGRNRDGEETGGSGVKPRETPQEIEKEPTPPPMKTQTPTPKPPPTPEKTPPPVPKVVSGGVVNGKATSLPKPAYPPAAKAVRAAGAVNVQVTIDENGSVISASAVSGHPLLRAAAESAARGAKFSPTLLSGQKVKVTGVIVYNFVAQ